MKRLTAATLFLIAVLSPALASEIKVEDADAVLEITLNRFEVPTKVIPATKLFIGCADAHNSYPFAAARLGTEPKPASMLFVGTADAVWEVKLKTWSVLQEQPAAP